MSGVPINGARVGRRVVLGIGLVGLAGVISPATAGATPVTLDRFGFDVTSTIRSQPPPDGWQWQGQLSEGGVPAIIVLARADLTAEDPYEVLGLLLASAAGGRLPGLRLGPTRERTTADRSPALRQPLRYEPAPKVTYTGSMLITCNGGAAAVLAVLGTNRLTAARIDQILDSARWTG